jgi:hypothetical protein
MMGKAPLLENVRPTRAMSQRIFRGNICRCGAYAGVETAILEAARGSLGTGCNSKTCPLGPSKGACSGGERWPKRTG